MTGLLPLPLLLYDYENEKFDELITEFFKICFKESAS